MLEQAEPLALTRAKGTITSATTTTLVAAQSSPARQIQVWRLIITSDAAQDITVKSDTTELGVLENVTSVGLRYNHFPWFTTVAGEALNLTTGGATNASYILDYTVGPIKYGPTT